MSKLHHDKLTEVFSIRIPAVTKRKLDALSPDWKRRLNHELLVKISEVLHMSSFDPSEYLLEEKAGEKR